MKKGFDAVAKCIDKDKAEMVKKFTGMIDIKALDPLDGGNGENRRSFFLAALLARYGIKSKTYRYRDRSGVYRPSVVARYGNADRTIWIVSHTDTVHAGDTRAWKTDPFRSSIKGDRIYGRGTADNGQDAIASIYALKALKESGAKLKWNVGLVLVADEEHGSDFGIIKLIGEDIFGKKDMFVVPDVVLVTQNRGKTGSNIEIAEKSVLWLKFTINGVQAHASTPEHGVNAYKNAVFFFNDLYEFIGKNYGAQNKLYAPSRSTFEITKHEKNVDNVNMIPGKEVTYMDCRIMPEYDVKKFIDRVKKFAKKDKYSKVGIEVEIASLGIATKPTPTSSEIYKMLEDALWDLRKIKAKPVGVGGATCAKMIRAAGWPALVWSTTEDVAHKPNEYANIKDLVDDCKVFAYLYL